MGFGITIEHFGPPDGATFIKLVIKSYNDDYVCFRRIDHSLMKIGWTKKQVSKCNSLTANALFRAKILSFKEQYKYSDKIQKLADLMLSTVGRRRLKNMK